MMKSLIALSLLAVPVSAPLHAAPRQADAIVRVSYADLDLSRDTDRAKLDRRLRTAIEQVCPLERPGSVILSTAGQRCRTALEQQITTARAQAVAQRGSVRISANP